jgi:hypothetical protein
VDQQPRVDHRITDWSEIIASPKEILHCAWSAEQENRTSPPVVVPPGNRAGRWQSVLRTEQLPKSCPGQGGQGARRYAFGCALTSRGHWFDPVPPSGSTILVRSEPSGNHPHRTQAVAQENPFLGGWRPTTRLSRFSLYISGIYAITSEKARIRPSGGASSQQVRWLGSPRA